MNFALALAITLNLGCVMMLDRGDERVEHFDELCSRLIGEPRKEEGQDNGGALQASSSSAVAMCSGLICRDFVAAAADRA